MTRTPRISVALLGLSLLGACSYNGGDVGDPLHRKFHWFSFVAGDDIAKSCDAASPDRYRLVYNAVWEQQIRIYEIDSARRVLRIRVSQPGNIATIRADDPLANWQAAETTVQLDDAAFAGLTATLAGDHAFGPAAVGLELPSHSYYWAAATCRQGQFTFTGWAYPSAAFDVAGFPAALATLDPGRQTIPKAGPVPLDPTWEYQRSRGAVTEFSLRVGAHGMVQ